MAVEKRRLFSPRQKILVGVSGGVDSMVLLHALVLLARTKRWEIFVAHFNHHLRGRASDADERLVRRTAANLRLKSFVGVADVKKFAAQSKLSVEMAARKLRHEFLAQTAREQKIAIIALAHHADDQVELFFLRLLRGAGGEGLAGMKWRSPSPADNAIALVRPLLDFPKAELLAFARENQIQFRTDATNFSTDFLRNRIRRELLPLIRKKYQPGLDKIILRLMNIVGVEAEFVNAAAKSFVQNRPENAPGQIQNQKSKSQNQKNFDELPVAVQRRVLQRQLAHLGVSSDFDLIEKLRAAADVRVNVTAGVSVARDTRGNVQLLNAKLAGKPHFNRDEHKFKLLGKAGRIEFAGRGFRWQLQTQGKFQLPQKRAGGRSARREFFDAGQIGAEIVLRHWRPGDRFQPIGMKSPVKLQDLFVNAKIPAALRPKLVVAASAAGEIFWVERLRIGEKFKLTAHTVRRLLWTWS